MVKQSGPGARIVICCYCDARSIINPDRERDKLVCHGCGAPIRKLERLEPLHTKKARKDGPRPGGARPAEYPGEHSEKDRPCRRKKKPKKRKTLFARLADGAEDLLDLDDLFDVFD